MCHISRKDKKRRGKSGTTSRRGNFIQIVMSQKLRSGQSRMEFLDEEFERCTVMCMNDAAVATHKEEDGKSGSKLRMSGGNYAKYMLGSTLTTQQKLRGLRYEMMHECREMGSCAACGVEDPLMLAFDHKDRSKKIATISSMCHAGEPVISISEEGQKTGLLCQNCHVIKGLIYGECIN